MPSTRRCVFGCNTTGVTIHTFPNPRTFQERFRIWVSLAGASVSGLTDMQIYANRKVCDRHFAEKDKTLECRNRRLNALAIPHLHMPMPLPTIASGPSLNLQSDDPSTSVRSLDTTTPLTQKEFCVFDDPVPTTSRTSLASKTTIPLTQMEICAFNEPVPTNSKTSLASRSRTTLSSVRLESNRKQLRKLRSEICRLRKGGRNFKERLQKAEKLLSSKAVLQTLTKKMALPAKIFTLLQFRECNKKPKGRRFLKEEKVLALSLYKRSPNCYALLSKCFTLPSAKSLKNLLSKIRIKEGVNPIIFKKLASNVKDLANDEKLCILMFDEMYINPQIHFNEREDTIKGLDSFNNKKIADHALTFMVKTIKNNNKQPVAYYFTNCLNALELKSTVKEVIREIHSAGLKIIATVCDQSRVNVSAIDSLVGDAKRSYLRNGKEWRHEVFIVDNASIIPIFDVPHLIKGIRNNLISKDVTYVDFHDNNQEKTVKWEYFQNIYEADKIDGELKILHKISEEHVYVEKMNKMKVKIATQLLSHSVAVAANYLTRTGQVDTACRQIIPFVKMFDNLFDSLNCHNFCEINGKVYRAGVRANSPHHRLWTEGIQFLKKLKFFEKKIDGQNVKMVEKKVPSVKNFIKTIEGMQAIWTILNKKYGFDIMFCRNFNQDPIENFFGRIRGVGARNVSPNSICFEGAYKSLLLCNFSSSHSIKSNCEDDMGEYFQSLDFMLDGNVDNDEEQINNIFNEDIIINEELLLDAPPVQQGGAGERSYVCGWVLSKCLKACKSCQTCRKDLIDDQNNENNELIRAKEYNFNKKSLIYPTTQIANLFEEIQKITESILKNNVPVKNLKNNIIMFIDMFVTFPFKCEKHKTEFKKLFVSKTVNVLIYSWCRIINKILNGKIKYDGDDEIKKYAYEYYCKRKKYGIEK